MTTPISTPWRAVDSADALTVSQLANPTDHLRDQMMDIIAPIMKQATETARQEALRERYPALREAWENYQMVLRLIDGETAGE